MRPATEPAARQVEAELLLIDGDEYALTLLPPGLSRRRMLVARRGSAARRYEVEELASGFVRCTCKGFQVRGECKHARAARAVGLVGEAIAASASGA